ncbi:Plant protein of unknown function (DUF868) [Melia azedarach]|uniref:Uncharacterized protein n=1 Tax=Melia azedarach TaxID=155640 RepID=A0ACC1XLX2_MELAZ|nr:Plant protein of unknown function (DUF868) [Melia azedarach]
MQDQIGIPACFSSSEKLSDDPAAVTRSGQSVFMSVYRTKIADQCRLITITCHGTFGGNKDPSALWWMVKLSIYTGTSRLPNSMAKLSPTLIIMLAVVCDEEVALLLGDLKKEAYRKTGCRPALIDPVLVSRKEHIFGKKKFSTRVKFHEKGRLHEISIECKNRSGNTANGNSSSGVEPEMEIRIDGHLVIHVKHLQWKFRGNESIHVNKARVEVYWDVHDWLFSPGLRHALFIFKPIISFNYISFFAINNIFLTTVIIVNIDTIVFSDRKFGFNRTTKCRMD